MTEVDPETMVAVELRIMLAPEVVSTRIDTGLLMRSGSAIGIELVGANKVVVLVLFTRSESATETSGTDEVVANMLLTGIMLDWLL